MNATESAFKSKDAKIEPDIVEFAGLAHDLGHPPFGHNGEEALDESMRCYGGFEGNAQSLRIVARLEKKSTLRQVDGTLKPFDANGDDLRCGLNLTYRSMAALLKYDKPIPERDADREKPGSIVKGYYREDINLVNDIKQKVLGTNSFIGKFKTIECSIMDIADDIAYSTYDLEDNFKAGLLTPMGLFALDDEVYEEVAKTIARRSRDQYPDIEIDDLIDADLVKRILFHVFEDILFGVDENTKKLVRGRETSWSTKKMLVAAEVQALSRKLASDGYQRVQFTSQLVQTFLTNLEVIEHNDFPQLHNVRLKFPAFLHVEVLKNITYSAIIKSPRLQVVEYRGKDIIKGIFNALKAPDGARLLPDDFKAMCFGGTELRRMRAICDFIAGMTDRYALEFHGRLYGANHISIHKPL
ncbi:dNTP triphosphohydrolase [Mesorhizobium microcysteis]|uniref:DNTP triphosphohydrolase n=1 Tax=Neoaquamicrobium microcysteis TaxID=2682781 RepID=A0A5D4GVN7_9HYPH|nr:dNTP triphosphohydrolase [Mesorhizobium microcysteis]TYR32931.1 dNTP triphosphohydrolase [Mesorhizobium microcysteis]